MRLRLNPIALLIWLRFFFRMVLSGAMEDTPLPTLSDFPECTDYRADGPGRYSLQVSPRRWRRLVCD